MTAALSVTQAQHVNRTRALAVASRLSDAALDMHVVCITIDAGATSIQLKSSADAAVVVERLGWDVAPVVGSYRGHTHSTWERDVHGGAARIVGLDRIEGAA